MKSHPKILIFLISYKTTNSVKPFYRIINKTNGYIEQGNGNKYLTLVPTDVRVAPRVRDLIKLIANKSDSYNEKYLKIKFNSGKNYL